MSFLHIIETQRSSVEDKISALLDRQHITEQQRDVAPTPKERAALDLQVSEIRTLVDSYKNELRELESELRELEKDRGAPRVPAEVRYPLDYDSPIPSSMDQFRNEVSTTLTLMGYDIAERRLVGFDSVVLIARQEGDFEDVKGIFHCVPGIIDPQLVTTFNGLFVQSQRDLGVRFASLITNSFIAPDARELAQTISIQVLAFGQLLNKLINFTPYLRKATEAYRSSNPLFRTYVESKYLRTANGKFEEGRIDDSESLVTQGEDSFVAKGDLSTYIDNWLHSPATEHICLLGDYGTGKTSFATHFFYQQATRFLTDPVRERLPVLISLSRYHTSADIVQMVTDFLANECNIKRNANMRAFLKMAEAGKLIVILDGFDEMAQQVDRNVRKRNFAEIARILVGRNKVIVSGRPNYFLEEAEITEILGQASDDADPYRAALQLATSNTSPRYEILNLALFDRWQIEEFLKHQAEFLKQQGIADWRELQNTIYDTYNLEELARTPVLLEIIIKTMSEIKKTVTDINAAKLYEIYTRFWLDREYDDKGEVRWLINRGEKEFFCLELAWQMLSSGESEPAIHYHDLSEKVRRHFKLERAYEIEYFSSDIRFCSFLVHSHVDGTYKFIHKSFMEYFAARYIFGALVVDAALERIPADLILYDEVCFFLQQLVTSEELQRIVELARSASDGFVVELSLDLLKRTSAAAERRGDISKAIEWAVETQQLCLELGRQSDCIDSLVLEGRLRASRGELDQARLVLFSAADLSYEQNDRERLASVFLRLGDINAHMAIYVEALQSYEQALEYLEETESQMRPQALNAIGQIRRTMGQADVAIECFRHALEINREAEDRHAEAITLMELGNSFTMLSRLDEALSCFEQSRRMFTELGDRINEGIILKFTSDVHRMLGMFEEAEAFLRYSLEIAERLNNRGEQADSIYRLGVLQVDRGQIEDAQQMFERALPISVELGDVRQSAEIRSALGHVFFSRAMLSGAEHHYHRALLSFEQMGDIRNVAIVNRWLGDLATERGEFETGHEVYEKAARAFDEIGDQRNLFHSLVALGALERKANRFDEAADWLSRAREVGKSLQIPHDMIVFHEQLGRLAEESGDSNKALQEFRKCADIAKDISFLLSEHVQRALAKADTLQRRTIPFEVSHPLRPDALLLGRQDVLQRLHHAIDDRQSVLLTGEHGMGKTSLLYHLVHLIEDPWVVVYTDGQRMFGGGTEAANAILSEVVHSLSKAELITSTRSKRVSLNYARDLTRAIRSLLDEARDRKPDVRLLLVIDEAETLFHRDDAELSSILRHLIQTEEAVTLVLSCVTVQRMLETERVLQGSPLSNTLVHIRLGPFTRSDVHEFVRRQAETIGLEFDREVVDEVFRLSAGQPLLIQSMCRALTEKAHATATPVITMKILDASRAEIIDIVYVIIMHKLGSLSPQQMEWLGCLSRDAALPELPRNAIQELVERYIVQEVDGAFEIQSPLLEQVVRSQVEL